MNGIRTEVFHFTREQVLEHARDALEILAELEVPIELAPIVFERCFDRLSSKQIAIEQVATSPVLAGLPNL